jgi:nitrite reductase/ring-hydroxylating ferredoxin subunit
MRRALPALMMQRYPESKAMKVPLCQIRDIPIEGTASVDFFGREVLVMQIDGVPKAIMNVCLHFGGTLCRDKDKMVCVWHRAEFDIRDGRRLKGPGQPDMGLLILPTYVEDGILIYMYGE